MPAAAQPNRPQTIKQAKAAYKARGQTYLTDKERRQLDRAVELDRRAWRTRETEKRAEAAKQKLERERRQRDERERLQMGSQRRCDKFGYKSSQMHLGAFLNKRPTRNEDTKETLQTSPDKSESESFGDDDLDDETLLDALEETNEASATDVPLLQPHKGTIHHENTTNTPQIPYRSLQTTRTSTISMNELDSIWNELDTSTQIERDLTSEEPTITWTKPTSKASSFSSDDFDLTLEDLEQLDPASPRQTKRDDDRKLMPPPPLPLKHVSPTAEFTMSELERFVDDDLQLTQVDPG